jgi:hypothetical protein
MENKNWRKKAGQIEKSRTIDEEIPVTFAARLPSPSSCLNLRLTLLADVYRVQLSFGQSKEGNIMEVTFKTGYLLYQIKFSCALICRANPDERGKKCLL